MKALIRDHNNEQLVYVNVKHNGNRFLDEEGREIAITNIIDVFRDNRTKYVRCSNCGELIKNTPEAIEAHWRVKASRKNCLQCEKMRETYSKTPIKKTFVPDAKDPDRYIVTNKYSVNLVCSMGYRTVNINSEDAKTNCKYFRCKNATYTPISDIFTQYPHLFDTLPTVDMLIKKKWKFNGFVSNQRYISYIHPHMKTLTAFANCKGIVTQFSLKIGSRCYSFMYSKKYDNFVYMGVSQYSFDFPYEVRNASKSTSAFAKVKELFEEVK